MIAIQSKKIADLELKLNTGSNYMEDLLHNLRSDVAALKCNLCEKPFQTQAELNLHVECEHDQPKDLYQSLPDVSSPQLLVSPSPHTSSPNSSSTACFSSTSGASRISCNVCKKAFAHLSELDDHIRENHPNLNCKVCGRTLRSESDLNVHHNRHHSTSTILFNHSPNVDQCTRSW